MEIKYLILSKRIKVLQFKTGLGWLLKNDDKLCESNIFLIFSNNGMRTFQFSLEFRSDIKYEGEKLARI